MKTLYDTCKKQSYCPKYLKNKKKKCKNYRKE